MMDMNTVEALEAEADKLGSRYVSWRECRDYLINCRKKPNGYEFRRVETATGPGHLISRSDAARMLASQPHWSAPQSAA